MLSLLLKTDIILKSFYIFLINITFNIKKYIKYII